MKMFAPSLKKADIEQALGIDFAGTDFRIPINWCAKRSTAACRSTR